MGWVGQGTQREIDSLVSGLGSQRLDISPGSRRGPGGARQSASSFYTLGEGDVDAIRAEIPEVQYVAGALRGGTQVVRSEERRVGQECVRTCRTRWWPNN